MDVGMIGPEGKGGAVGFKGLFISAPGLGDDAVVGQALAGIHLLTTRCRCDVGPQPCGWWRGCGVCVWGGGGERLSEV